MKKNSKLENLFKYLELLTDAYFEGDPLDVKPIIKRVTFLVEMELNDLYKGEEFDASKVQDS